MRPEDLHQLILDRQSFLCVGLDPDLQKFPPHLRDHPRAVVEFNRQIIEATSDLAVAYKPNLAFFEALGPKGWEVLEETLSFIPPETMTIADAKRGDIGNTSRMYAEAFFKHLNFDAVTVAPYMGRDSVAPFLEYEDKWVFLLALTSNAGAEDFQWFSQEGQPLYEKVIESSLQWAEDLPGHLGFVTGATRPEYIGQIRSMAPDSFFLVPGVGAQGGDLHAVADQGINDLIGLLVNSSRGILYAGQGEDFAEKARAKALELQQEMAIRIL